MGLLSMFYFPWGDQYAYFNDLEECRYIEFSEKFDFNSLMIIREFNVINLLLFLSAKLGLNLEIFRFLLTFISTCLIFRIYIDLNDTYRLSENKRYRFILFIILWLSVPYYLISYGFRTGFGGCILVYGVYLMYVKNRALPAVMCYLLASAIHFFFIVQTILFVVFFFYRGKLSIKKTLLIACTLNILSMAMFSLLYGYIPFLDTIMNFYVYGEKYGAGSYDWSSSSSKELWLNGVLNTFVMFIIFFRLNNKGKFENIIYLLFILCAFSLTFALIFQRVIRSIVPIMSLYIILQYKSEIVNRAKYIIIGVLLVAFIYPFILHRDKYEYAHLERIIYAPLPILLKNHYDSNMIHVKVYTDGSYKQ